MIPCQERGLHNKLRTHQSGFLDLAAGYGWNSGSRFKHTLRAAVKNTLDDVFVEGGGDFSFGRKITTTSTIEY